MLRDHCLAMAGYNRWMNHKLYALAAELSDEERKRDQKAFFKSLHGTLAHILFADQVWLARFAGTPLAPLPALDDFHTLRDERARKDDEIDRFAAGLTEERLSASFTYKSFAGEPFEHPLWWAVTHCFNHQTHHRGQATTLLMQLGRDPGVTDLIAFLRTRSL